MTTLKKVFARDRPDDDGLGASAHSTSVLIGVLILTFAPMILAHVLMLGS